jgi:triosephosphate isomerase
VVFKAFSTGSRDNSLLTASLQQIILYRVGKFTRMLKLPIMIINFKAYETGVGKNAIALARICERVAKETGASIAVAVQAADIRAVSEVSIPVLAQHVDSVEFGAHTGSVLPEAVKASGAVGSLLNHSERRVDLRTIEQTIQRLHELKMPAVVCAHTPVLAMQIARLKPDHIAIEPPELIGGTVAVSQAKPEVITQTTQHIQIPVLCGAGIHTKEDVRKAVELGVQGILVSSGVVNAKDPEKVLRQLVQGFR